MHSLLMPYVKDLPRKPAAHHTSMVTHVTISSGYCMQAIPWRDRPQFCMLFPGSESQSSQHHLPLPWEMCHMLFAMIVTAGGPPPGLLIDHHTILKGCSPVQGVARRP